MGGHEVHLVGDRRIVLRSAIPPDVAAIAALFAGLSSESFTRRFRTPRSPSRALLRMARIDHHPGTVSIVAERLADVRFVVAEARVQPLGPGLADLAIAVADSYQNAGLGPLLLDAVLERARCRGVRRLRAVVGQTNAAMLGLLAARGWVISEPADGAVIHLEGAPDGKMPAFPARDGRRRVLVEGGGWVRGAVRTWQPDDLVRRCLGPVRALGGTCPLVVSGRCRLAEGADVIVTRLPAGPACDDVMGEHRGRWPERLA